jgi:hypothetical protein
LHFQLYIQRGYIPVFAAVVMKVESQPTFRKNIPPSSSGSNSHLPWTTRRYIPEDSTLHPCVCWSGCLFILIILVYSLHAQVYSSILKYPCPDLTLFFFILITLTVLGEGAGIA